VEQQNRDLSPLLWTCGGAIAGFVFLAWLKSSDWGRQFDVAVLTQLQSVGDEAQPLGPAWLREAGRDLTALGSISVLVFSTLAVAGWLLVRRNWRGALMASLAIAGGIGLSFLLKMLYSVPRPDLLTEPTAVFTSSFPSSHAMAALVTYVSLAWVIGRGFASQAFSRYLMACALMISLISGLSRLYLGVHWPTDVMAGWLAGTAWLALCAAALQAWNPTWITPQHAAALEDQAA
jgi:undecaprenyl-diphosphatase